MRKTHKKVLGILGLVLVVATTIFAATLPGPDASATGVSSVTDHIMVRVVGVVPDISISNIENGETTTSPEQSLNITYENVATVKVTIEHTDKDGNVTTREVDVPITPGESGTVTLPLDLSSDELGYGEYVITVRGAADDGVFDEESISFSYFPVIADVTEDSDTGNYEADLDYHQGEEGGEGDENEVASIEVNVYDENGNLVDEMSPITVTPPETKVQLPFGDLGLPSGIYTVVVTSYDKNGEQLYEPYVFTINYKAIDVEVPKTADTGGLFQNLNISKSDYLVTGLVVFFIVAGAGAIYIVRNGKKPATKSNKRR